MVSVVDTFNFFKDFGSPERLMDRELTDIEDDYRTIVNLLTDQIEFANVILINKSDLVSKDDLGFLEATLKKLNPSAQLVSTSFGKIKPKRILNTGLFNFEEAEQSAGWQEELNKEEHTPESEEYRIGSFVFRSQKPFHPERFSEYVQQKFPSSVIRSKGLFWLASRPEQAMVWGQAGGSLRTDSAGVWWCSMSFDRRSQYVSFLDNQKSIEADWDKTFGDRKNEIVFIGQAMNETRIRKELNHCLLTEDELVTVNWQEGYQDEWPVERAYAIE